MIHYRHNMNYIFTTSNLIKVKSIIQNYFFMEHLNRKKKYSAGVYEIDAEHLKDLV